MIPWSNNNLRNWDLVLNRIPLELQVRDQEVPTRTELEGETLMWRRKYEAEFLLVFERIGLQNGRQHEKLIHEAGTTLAALAHSPYVFDRIASLYPAGSAPADVLLEPWPETLAAAKERLKIFPSAGRAVVADFPGFPDQLIAQNTPFGQGARVYFSIGEGQDHVLQFDLVTGRAPEYRFSGEHWLIPGLVQHELLSPLMLWWVLLFGLSMLARYHPGAWVSALDVNESPLAVPLEDALDIAMTAVPHLVLEALLQRPFVLHRR